MPDWRLKQHAAFAPNPQRVKNHIPKYHSSGNGRDFYVRDAQVRINTIPMTADVYRAQTFRRPKRRTKEINYPIRPPRYIMDGSGRDGFVFLHGDVGKPNNPNDIFRKHVTPWGQNSTAPWAFDPRLTVVCKNAGLRMKPNSTGVKIVAARPYGRRPQTSGQSPRIAGRRGMGRPSKKKVFRQRSNSNRLSQPFKKNVVDKGMYRGSRDKQLVPWVGNSVRGKRPVSAAAGIGIGRTKQAGAMFRDLDLGLLN